MEAGYYDPVERRREKQADREQDEADLASGRKTAEQLQQENSMFSQLGLKIDWSKSRIQLSHATWLRGPVEIGH